MSILTDLVAAPRAAALTIAERAALEFNDADNGARILAAHGADMVFVIGKGWAVWDGRRYSFQFGHLAAREIGHKLRDLVLEEAEWARRTWEVDPDDLQAFMDANERKRPPVIFRRPLDAEKAMRGEFAARLYKHARTCGNVAKVKSALEVCEYQRRAAIADLDADPFAFVVPNGQVDLRAVLDTDWLSDDDPATERALRAGQRAEWLRPVDRAALPTKCAGATFDPAADCPSWQAFLELIVPNAAIRSCLHRCLGATIFGENRAQVALILRGPGGNGKSTLLNALTHVMGAKDGYAAPCKIEMFLETGNASSGAATPEEVNLPGARAYIATEPGARDVLSAKKIKGLTGGDTRMSRGNFQDFFFWTPRGTPILSCNRTPKIKDEDEGTRRRLVFLPFDVNLRALPADRQRPQGEVEAEMRAEAAGILNWLLDGFREFMHRGIDMPQAMVELKAALLESADPVGVFVAECCVPDVAGRLNVTDFYNVYLKWCEQEGRTLYQMKTVGDVMIEKGFERGKSHGSSVWRGLAWAPAAHAIIASAIGYDKAPVSVAPPF